MERRSGGPLVDLKEEVVRLAGFGVGKSVYQYLEDTPCSFRLVGVILPTSRAGDKHLVVLETGEVFVLKPRDKNDENYRSFTSVIPKWTGVYVKGGISQKEGFMRVAFTSGAEMVADNSFQKDQEAVREAIDNSFALVREIRAETIGQVRQATASL